MRILRTVAELREWRAKLDGPLGFVPTMGALHEGHLALARLSKQRCASTVVSIFVNPTQFGPKEDLSKYPRPFEKDVALLECEGVDALFAPSATEMYPTDASTAVVEESVSLPLCGSFRPGHFRGVATVVLKLFNQVQPDVAFFGQKDAQQCAVIERMVRDLDVPVTIVRGETVREKGGLAMSSRNVYLSPDERERAPAIYRSLRLAAEAYARGERDPRQLERLGRTELERGGAFKTQYWEARKRGSLAAFEPGEAISGEGVLLAVAVYLGSTRLIDNIELF